MDIFFQDILGWVGVILTTILSLPQIIKIIKEKKAQLSLTSFGVLAAGILLWIFFGITASVDKKPIEAIIANYISFGLILVTFFLFLKHNYKKMMWYFTIGASILMGILLFLIILALTKSSLNLPDYLNGPIGILAVLGTSLAFLPQTINLFKTKNIQGVSFFLLVIGFFINFTWEFYWGYQMFKNGISFSFIIILIFQAIAMVLYIAQMSLYLIIKRKR